MREASNPAEHRNSAQPDRVLKEHLGHQPLTALEEPDEINRFKTDSEWAEDVEIASIHRVLDGFAPR